MSSSDRARADRSRTARAWRGDADDHALRDNAGVRRTGRSENPGGAARRLPDPQAGTSARAHRRAAPWRRRPLPPLRLPARLPGRRRPAPARTSQYTSRFLAYNSIVSRRSMQTARYLAASLAIAAAALVMAPLSAQPARPLIPTDIAGEWSLTNNEEDTTAQPPLGDYLGIPFNAAGRQRSETTAESIWGTPEYQCRPHSAPHQWRGLGGARILKEQDPLTREVRAYHFQFMLSLDRPVYMDGRPHPPAWAPHTWSGFSTGELIGNTLKVTTTHLKDGYLRRGGPQTSDMLKMTEYITRHDDILTIVTVTEDPIYLDEPFVQSTTYMIDLNSHVAMEECDSSAFAQNGGTDRHHVPHFLPGQNTALTEWLKAEDWVPVEPTRGGVKTLYPEYRATLGGSVNAASLKVPSSRASFAPDKSIVDQSPRDGQVHVLPVQGNIYMLV